VSQARQYEGDDMLMEGGIFESTFKDIESQSIPIKLLKRQPTSEDLEPETNKDFLKPALT
jgi:hypothetical protein